MGAQRKMRSLLKDVHPYDGSSCDTYRTPYSDELRRGGVPSRSRSMEPSLQESPVALDSQIWGYKSTNPNERKKKQQAMLRKMGAASSAITW